MAKDNGLHTCENLPPTKIGDLECTEPARPNSPNLPTNTSCVNWNQYYTECRAGDKNPFQGAMSFDNIGLAWVAIFLVISLEGWTDIMYYIQDAHSFWDFIYFVLLIVIGAFFMINLCLVVIATQFSETKKRETERMRLERARFQSTSTLGSSLENAGCYAEILRYVAHLWRRLRRKLRYRWRRIRRKPPSRFSLRRRRRGDYGQECSHDHPRRDYRRGRAVRGEDPESGRNNNNFFCDRKVDEWAPQASPEVSDVDPLSTPRRPDGEMPTGSGALVPVGLGEPDSSDCERGLDSHLLPPGILCSRLSPDTGRPPERRAKSVSYDVNKPVIIPIQRLAAGGEGDVVETVPPQLRAELSRAESQLRKLRSSVFPRVCRSADRGPLSCTELLAISGALSAALPAQLAQVPLRHSSQQLPSALAGVTGGPVTTRQLSEPALPGLGSPPLDSARTASDASWSGDSEDSCSSDEEDYSDEDCEEYWSEYEDDEPRTPRCPRVRAVLRWIRASVKRFIEHSYTQKGILLAIMINTLSMGVEYHNQPPWLTTLVETSNIVFSAVFALEMMLKLIADGFYGYIRNGFNVFDGLIVIISAVDLYKSQFSTTGSEGGSSLSVLRTFRLLRILKLVRFLPNLRRQLLVMLKTMDNVAIFFSLLILFIFIFSILGMNLFGCRFCRKDDKGKTSCDRKNFDSLLWACITVFQ
ncbi:voltage-dependent T-type calcium channel subunit alpha-1I-like, partial [Amphibalanus amphitrite]|uniref:voltage-dependent T-type calcium channel subunit alpha-1I-like n=1 Tax=Amphibalanus amphitrite TaxID=1232801 RepID=UPI001C91A402